MHFLYAFPFLFPLLFPPRNIDDCMQTGNDLEVVERIALIEWLANNYKTFGTSLEIITDKSQEGSQFCRGFGGIGGKENYSYYVYICMLIYIILFMIMFIFPPSSHLPFCQSALFCSRAFYAYFNVQDYCGIALTSRRWTLWI